MRIETKLTDYTYQNLEDSSIRQIASIARGDWRRTSKAGIYFGAVPYLEAMDALEKITDNYFADSGKSIVMYFLSNSTGWKGEVARQVKAHLNKLLK